MHGARKLGNDNSRRAGHKRLNTSKVDTADRTQQVDGSIVRHAIIEMDVHP